MARRHRHQQVLPWLLSALSMAAAVGCEKTPTAGPSTAPATLATTSPATRPEAAADIYPTPEALLDRYNELNGVLPPNLPEIVKLYHAENEVQQKWVRWLNNSAAFYELDKAMYEQFNEPWVASPERQHMNVGKPSLARIVARREDRAQAEFTNAAGETKTLQLVHVINGWKISGFTLEYGLKVPNPEKFLAAMERSNPDPTWLPQFIARIRAGEFKTAEEAREVRRQELRATRAAPPAGE
jgi:hypothetical protein